MKPFALFFGESGQMGTFDVTTDSKYKLVVETVNQLRDRLLNEEVLRKPLLHLFNSMYRDGTYFQDDLNISTPIADQVSNMAKIRQIRHHPPTDNDVVDFLTNTFPDLYLAPGDFSTGGVGETLSGRAEADKEKIMIDVQLVQLWLQAVLTSVEVKLSKLRLMFIAVFLRELAHSSLVWYGMEAYNSSQPGGIGREAGEYVERAFFGGIPCCELELKPLHVVKLGIMKDDIFYHIPNNLATKLTKLDTSKGLPLLDISALSPAPPVTAGRIRSKFGHAVPSMTRRPVLVPKKMSSTHIYSTVKNDKIRIMPPSV